MVFLLDLPTEILLSIISYLDSVEDKLNFSRVLNLSWSLLLTSPKCWHTSFIISCPGVSRSRTQKLMSCLNSLYHFLHFLEINHNLLESAAEFEPKIDISFLGSCENLRKIVLVNVDLFCTVDQCVPKLNFLREFRVKNVSVDPKFVNTLVNLLCSCSELRTLFVEDCGLLSCSTNLERIVKSCFLLENFHVFADSDSGSDSLFEALSELRNLEECSIDVDPEASKEAPQNGFVSFCTKSRNLKYLSLINQITIERNLFLWLGKLTSLEKLNLLKCTITASVIAELSHLNHLKELYCSGFALNNSAGEAFGKGFQSLTKVQLSNATMWSQGFRGLTGSLFAQNIVWGCFSSCRSLDNSALISMATEFNSIAYLDLSYCYNITDKGKTVKSISL